ncbi:MnhB domain-containing protein [Candidatus Aerophobetes bacterium]|nr:MnhB domain-containing protein [Candidatus Aerophobetes bacterium]
MRESEIVDMISRKLSPYILLFALYLISYGHLSPGGGFQGGVVLASGVILLCLARGEGFVKRKLPPKALSLVETGMFFIFILMGLAGLLIGGYFLENFFLPGKIEKVPTESFIFFLNLVIGLKVGAGITLICFYILKQEET